MGQIQLIRAYRMDSGHGMGPWDCRGKRTVVADPPAPTRFFWSTVGHLRRLMIHQIDECCWIKDAWPVTAHGVGGRTAGSTDCSQNLD